MPARLRVPLPCPDLPELVLGCIKAVQEHASAAQQVGGWACVAVEFIASRLRMIGSAAVPMALPPRHTPHYAGLCLTLVSPCPLLRSPTGEGGCVGGGAACQQVRGWAGAAARHQAHPHGPQAGGLGQNCILKPMRKLAGAAARHQAHPHGPQAGAALAVWAGSRFDKQGQWEWGWELLPATKWVMDFNGRQAGAALGGWLRYLLNRLMRAYGDWSSCPLSSCQAHEHRQQSTQESLQLCMKYGCGWQLAAHKSCAPSRPAAHAEAALPLPPSFFCRCTCQHGPPLSSCTPWPQWRCEESGLQENLWLNLSTGHIGSGRAVSSSGW